MIQVRHFDHIQMDVANLEESLKFYEDVFQFRVVEIGLRQLTRWAIVGNGTGLFLCMHEFARGKGTPNDGLEITHFGLIVEDFESVTSKLIKSGVRLVYEQPVNYHSSRSVYFLDPNDYKIEISEFSGGGLMDKYRALYG